MPPPRLVLDTNVLVSATLKRNSLPRAVFTLALSKSFRLYVSQPIVDEYANVLSREELGIRKAERLQMLQLIKNHAHIVFPSRRLDACRDEDDNKFLECAEAAQADYLVTGNRKHFPATWRRSRVITSLEFVQLVDLDL